MKRLTLLLTLLLFSNLLFSQQTTDEKEINKILKTFKDCIIKKDSVTLYNLFHKGPVTWVGVYKEITQKERLKKDSLSVNYKISDYKTWFRNVCKPEPRREDFNNIEIIEDGSIASVTFDYSFWVNNKKGNWGKEFWHLVKEKDNWKIASVIFSLEFENINPEPNQQIDIDNSSAPFVRNMASELLKIANLPGFSIAIRKKDSIVFAEGFGYADIEKKIPVTTVTQFRAASTSKVIAATGLGILIQDGLIDINASIEKYVPYFPKKDYAITVKQLAGHIAGMPHYTDTDKQEDRFYSSVKDALTVFSHQKLIEAPETKYSYSSHGYTLLSAAMEGASGVKYLDYLQDKVLNPLSMKSTEVDMRQYKLIPNLSKIYEQVNGENVFINNPRKMSSIWAAGGMITTPTDLVNMTKAYSNGYLKPETVKLMFESQKLKSGEKTQVGLGWRSSYDIDGRKVIEHAGATQGTRAVICYFPDEELAISIMTNTAWVSSIESTAHMLAKAFRVENKTPSSINGEYNIAAHITQSEKTTTTKGKLKINEGQGQIILENGNKYTILYLNTNVFALITNQGIYHLTIDLEENNTVSGKAIRYQSQLLESPVNLTPFFTFKSE